MFLGKKKVSKKVSTEIKNTLISQEMELEGILKGEGAVQIEGIFTGDIEVTSVVIGENGIVNGTIKAKNVIVNGYLNGSVSCSALEIMPNGSVSKAIQVQKVLIAGIANGTIEAQEEIKLERIAKVNVTLMKGKNIIVNGLFRGKLIASELLIIGSNGSITGEITVKNIKTYEGGKLRGSIHNYLEDETFTPLQENSLN